jgi:hemerythrin
MSIVFVWEEQYAVGDQELDKQHQYLFYLGNKIQKDDKNQAKAYVMKLYKYAAAHFKAEEEHMKQIKYPDVENHRKLHDKFITDLNKISEEFSNESFDEFKTFLYTWLIDHILNEDNKYFIFSNHQKET